MYDRHGQDLQIRDVVVIGYGVSNASLRMGYVRRIGKVTVTVWSDRDQRLWTGSPNCIQKLSPEEAMLWKLEKLENL